MWCGVMGASAVEWFPQTAFSWQKSGFLFAGWLTAAESMLALFAMRPIKKREGSGRGGFMKISCLLGMEAGLPSGRETCFWAVG